MPLDALSVDKGAIGAVQIGKHKDALLQIDACMVPGSAFIGQTDVVVARTANAGTLQRQGIASSADLQPGAGLAGPRRLIGQLDIAQAQPVTRVQHRAGHPLPVDEKAVGTPQILHSAPSPGTLDARMAARD
jgi:hypothetical protein